VQARLKTVRALRQAGKLTTPSTLAEEWRTNPFMRSDSATIQAAVKQADPGNDLSPASVLAVVRELKNNF
jgi:hydroxyacylglutathione hydrolase